MKLLYLCFVDCGEFESIISCCQQVALLWALLWKMLILLPHFLRCVTIWQPIYNWVCVCVCVCEIHACLRSVKLCWACPLLSRPTEEGPGGRSALRDRVHGHFLCRVGVTKKERKRRAEPPESCRCCQRAGPVLHVTKPKTANLSVTIPQCSLSWGIWRGERL